MMRRALRSSCLGLIALLPVAALAAPPHRQAATQSDLQDAEKTRAAELAARRAAEAEAARAAAEEQKLAEERIAAAARLRQAEGLTEEAAAKLEALNARKREAERRLAERAEAMQPLLPLIQRLSLFPAETLLAVPAEPEQRLRGVLVLQGLARRLEVEAEELRKDQKRVEEATRAIQAESPKYMALLQAQKEQAEALDRQIAAARALREKAEGDADAASRRAAAAALRAEDLRAALAALEKQRKLEEARARAEAERAEKRRRAVEAENARKQEVAMARPTGPGTIAPNSKAKGQLITPVAGRVVRAWGEATDVGPANGVSYQAAPAARVVSPCGGRAVFADRFRSYGLLLIVDCGGGFHVVLAGFDRLDARAGQPVQAGEPIGVMPSWDPGSAGRRPSLYVELRHDGRPVNPAPWLHSAG